jgi:glycosyltransferase involved in cell wall biosynthesis
MAYNYQSIKGRIKRLIWLLKSIRPYVFKKKKKQNNDVLVSIIGETEGSLEWFKNDINLRQNRFIMYSLPETKVYLIFFSPFQNEIKQKLELGKDCIVLQYKNSYNGMKQFLKDFYEISPKWLKIHDSLLNGINDIIISKVFKTKLMFMPRGMNYYGDFLFRDKSNLVQFLKAYYNQWIYIKCIKSSDIVVGNTMFALENELISGKKVYTTDYLYYFGAIEALNLKPKDDAETKYNNLLNFLKNYDYNLLFFGRVEEIKVGFLFDVFEKIENDFNVSLTIIGDGSKLNEYKLKYKNNKNIYFTGWMQKQYLFAIANNFDLLIAPHGGYTNIQLGILGVPSVSYWYDSMADIIYNNFNGFLIDKTTPKELEIVLKKYLKLSQEKKREFKKNTYISFNRRFCLEQFEISKMNLVNKMKDSQ